MSTPPFDQFQCPQCQLSGDMKLFEPGWPVELNMLIVKHPELGIKDNLSDMDYKDARYLYNWLSRHES